MAILRIARPGHGQDDPAFVLVNVVSEGRNDLDLKLVGSDNSEVFSTTFKHSQTSKLKAKSNKSTPAEWDNVLLEVLLGQAPVGVESAAQQGIEAIASIESEALSITIQKKIEGITQKLGTISLAASEEEVDFFDWCGQAVQSKDNAKHGYEEFRTTVLEKDVRINKLQDALMELTSLKRDNEAQLLEKFALLLNEKKLKIRDQQRLLSGANLDPEKVAELKGSRAATQSRDAGPSRKGKRKATEKAELSVDSDDGFEKMDIDAPVANNSDQDGNNTSDEATATEDEDEPLPPRKAAATKKKSSVPVEEDEDEEPMPLRTKRGAAVAKKITPVKKSSPARAKTPSATQDEPPPKRALPFAKKLPVQPPKPQGEEDGSETESDDEL